MLFSGSMASMIEIHKPEPEELWFRESLMADEATMSFNHAWGGPTPFPKTKWAQWYHAWAEGSEYHRYYRYLLNQETGAYVGEISYHFDTQRNIHLCDVIVLAKYRNKGFGTKGIQLLCNAAKENGVTALYDDIAADNPSVSLFLKSGFTIDYQNDDVVMVKKVL